VKREIKKTMPFTTAIRKKPKKKKTWVNVTKEMDGLYVDNFKMLM
jgi:hypothetical protein